MVLTQSLLQTMEDNYGAPRNNVLAVVYYVSPASAIILLPIALFTEASDYTLSRFLVDLQLLMMSLFFIFISGLRTNFHRDFAGQENVGAVVRHRR